MTALLLTGCGPSRDEQIGRCVLLRDGDHLALARCLVDRYDWDPDEAMRVELDSSAAWRARGLLPR